MRFVFERNKSPSITAGGEVVKMALILQKVAVIFYTSLFGASVCVTLSVVSLSDALPLAANPYGRDTI